MRAFELLRKWRWSCYDTQYCGFGASLVPCSVAAAGSDTAGTDMDVAGLVPASGAGTLEIAVETLLPAAVRSSAVTEHLLCNGSCPPLHTHTLSLHDTHDGTRLEITVIVSSTPQVKFACRTVNRLLGGVYI